MSETKRTPTASLSPATRAWLWGGSAILVSGLLRLLEALPIVAMIGSGPVALMAALAFALGISILAIGIRGQGSVVARRRSGVVALLVLAGIDVVQGIIVEWFGAIPAGARDAVIVVSDLLVLVQLAAAIVAVIVIARAGAVKGALRWMPLAALALVVTLQLTIRIGLSEQDGFVSPGVDFFVLAQVGLSLLDAALGFLVMFASPRASMQRARTT